MNKKSILLVFTVLIMFTLSGCISINVKDVDIGVDAGVNAEWDYLEDRFDILKYVPKFADTVDYFCLKEGNTTNYEGVEIGFKEVDKPKDLAYEIMEMLDDEGYEYVGDRCITNWNGTPEGQCEKDNYHCFNFSYDVNENGYSRVAIFIEYFDNKYPNSHNVFLRVTPEKDNVNPN